jgi:hypothetical protein
MVKQDVIFRKEFVETCKLVKSNNKNKIRNSPKYYDWLASSEYAPYAALE